jgi:hypothetical protein
MIRTNTNPDQLIKALEKYYHGPEKILVHELTTFLTTIVQDNACLLGSKESQDTTLQDILCSTSLAFVPRPVTKNELEHNGKLINGLEPLASGTYGRVYEQVINNHPIVIKTPLSFREDSMRELYLQYVVINSILLKEKLTNHLIPAYGFFMCSSDVNSKHKEDKLHPLSICEKKGGMLHTIQQKMDGVSFPIYLIKKKFSFTIYRELLKEIFSTLISLEASSYCIHHNDLHTSNIMIVKKHAVLLDWGMASFIVNDQSFCPTKEHKYHTGASLHTGACDAYLLLYSILQYVIKYGTTETNDISMDVLHVLDKLGQMFYEEKNGKIQPLTMHLKKYVHSYEKGITHNGKELFVPKERLSFYKILSDLEEHTSSEQNKKKIHELHLAQLKKATYAYISTLFDPPLLTIDEIEQAQDLLLDF